VTGDRDDQRCCGRILARWSYGRHGVS
jgi:hypothetical protein